MGDLIFFILVLFGSALGCLLLWKIFDLVRSSINKNKALYDEEVFERLANAFIKHKKETDQRLQHIEHTLRGLKPQSPRQGIDEAPEAIGIGQDHTEEENHQISDIANKRRHQS